MVTLEQAKKHNWIIEPDFDEEIQTMIEAAKDHLASIDIDMDVDPLPPALHHAVLLLVGHFFENRGATNAEQLRFTPIGVDRLIAPYREVTF